MDYSTSPSLLFLEDANMLGIDSIVFPINVEESMSVNETMYPLYSRGMAVPFLPYDHTYPSAGGHTSQKIPTADEWENHRVEITRLYRDEKKTLAEVMTTMRQRYGFKATPKMYKTRISKWGIRRNLRWSEREDACRVMKHRLLTGEKGSKVVIRGQERDIGLLRRHMRHPKSLVKSRVPTAEVRAISNAVITSSSQGYRHASHILCQDFMEQYIHRNLYPAEDQREVERVCLNVSYFCGIATDLTSLRRSSRKLFNYFYTAEGWLRLKNYEQARLSLSQALDRFGATVCANPSGMLFGWLDVFTDRKFEGNKWHFFDQAARNAYDLSSVLCGSSHPVTMVLSHISRNPDRLSAIATILQAAIASLERRCKPMDTFKELSWLRQYLIFIWERMGSLSNAIALVELDIEERKCYGISQSHAKELTLKVLNCKLHHGPSCPVRFHGVLKTISGKKLEKSRDIWMRTQINDLRAHQAMKVGNYMDAESIYRESSTLILERYGQSDPKYILVTLSLAESLRKQGRYAEAEHELDKCRLTDDIAN